MPKVAYIVGLPRSGSTLLANALGQHPDLGVTPTSPLRNLVGVIRDNWRKLHRATTHDDEQLKRVIKSTIEAYHDNGKLITLDKNRDWLGMYETLETAFNEKPKMILIWRELEDVVTSLEKIWRKNVALGRAPTESGNPQVPMTTSRNRAYIWTQQTNIVGNPENLISDAVHKGFVPHIHLVHYSDLCKHPRETLNECIEYLGLPPHQFDPDNVEQLTQEDDEWHGYTGLHTIRPKIEWRESEAHLYLDKEVVDKLKIKSQQLADKLT